MNPPTRPLELLLPKDQPVVSAHEMWLGIGATLVVMTVIGLWFVGAL